jgi:cytochrome c oxidase assembly factor CtaG
VLRRLPRGKSLLPIAAVILVLLSLVPPVGTYTRRYVFAESFQFAVYAAAVPALLVLGAPWRALGLSRLMLTLTGRRATSRRGGPGSGSTAFWRGVGALLVFMGTVVAWRLPVSVNALARVPGLVAVEMLTLGAAGTVLWLELVESPPLLPRLTRPLRAVFATLAMWAIWVVAYILGFSQVAWFTAYSHPGLGALADQEIATGIMWAVPAFCFIPVVYVTALGWLRDGGEPDEELRTLAAGESPSRPGRWPRPPRGWSTR